MILRTRNGNRASVRGLFDGADAIPRPGETLGAFTYAGRPVDADVASGLPAVMSAIRLLSETVACLPLEVYRMDPAEDESMVDAPETSQWRLLHDQPSDSHSAFSFISLTVASLQGYGNAYALKAKSGPGQVEALYPLNPSRVTPKVEQGELCFYVKSGPNAAKRLTRAEVLHVPGVLWNDPQIGISPIAFHRNSLGSFVAQDEYSGRFYANDATPGGVISVPGSLKRDQRSELVESWEQKHRGPAGAARVAVLTGGATFDQIGINLRDAQFIEGKSFSVLEIARMFRVPASMLDADVLVKPVTAEEEAMKFLTYSLLPWLRRVESAFHADDDLFPDKSLCPRFEVDSLLRADIKTRWDSYRLGRQGGWITANEIREIEGMPPAEGGDELQATPVGGAPNAGDPAGEPAPDGSTNEPPGGGA